MTVPNWWRSGDAVPHLVQEVHQNYCTTQRYEHNHLDFVLGEYFSI